MAEILHRVDGVFYDGKTSRAYLRELLVLADGSADVSIAIGTVSSDPQQSVYPSVIYPYQSLRISSRLGNTPRYINFPDGGKFETMDNAVIDRWQQQFDPSGWHGLAHLLESRKRFVLFSVMVVMISLWAIVTFGIPTASAVIAKQLPYAVSHQLGDGTLEMLDEYVFAPSNLDEQRRQQLVLLFDQYFAEETATMGLALHFRASKKIGANAFALPSGDIVFTDAMVELAGDERELLAVIAHEVGHVAHRHVLRRVVQNSFLLFVLTIMTGDVIGSSSLMVAAPTLLLEMAYSRAFEREADRYALAFLRQQDIDPVHFSNLMQRVQWQEASSAQPASTSENQGESSWQQAIENARYYLSSHPDWEQRVGEFGKPTIKKEATTH